MSSQASKVLFFIIASQLFCSCRAILIVEKEVWDKDTIYSPIAKAIKANTEANIIVRSYSRSALVSTIKGLAAWSERRVLEMKSLSLLILCVLIASCLGRAQVSGGGGGPTGGGGGGPNGGGGGGPNGGGGGPNGGGGGGRNGGGGGGSNLTPGADFK
uniref:Uncharacterized protein n=1 Tax=Glossina pallidipes TaxID=7398 RepID=A0A1B0A258_GLOPL